MELSDALTFARDHKNGVLTTIKRDGRPQLSNITYHIGSDGALKISGRYRKLMQTGLANPPCSDRFLNMSN